MKSGKKSLKVLVAAIFAAFTLSLFSGCSRSLGYSVLLWSNPEQQLTDGTLLKVYIKSNISHVYVVSVPGSKEKFEVPLWQITEPLSKGKASKFQAKVADFEHTYASVKLDGLPIRAEAVNTAKQVYRLRQGEIIRCLYRGKGAAVTNGKGSMSGEWLRVLTSSGTQGWCFSHNLELFQAGVDVVFNGSGADADSMSAEKSVEEGIKKLIAKKWYPESYKDMIKAGRIDTNRMKSEYGFDFGITDPAENSLQPETENFAAEGKKEDVPSRIVLSGTASYMDESTSQQWKFTDITKKSDNEYQFKESNLTVTVRGQNTLVIQYMEKGKVKAVTLVALSQDIDEILENEMYRRQDELKSIAAAGPVFKSSNYGTIKFNNERSVTWSGYKMLVPAVISENALGSVTVSIDYFISNSLKSSYDGVITMHFTGMEDGVRFLYKLTEKGLRLEDATKAPVKEGVVTARSASPMVLFFEKN